VSKHVRILLGVVATGLGLFGAAGDAASPPEGPVAAANGLAVRVVLPGQPAVSTPLVGAPPNAQAFLGGFQYPSDGSIVQTGAITVTATATVTPGGRASAVAGTDVSAISLFRGEITADAVAGRAKSSASQKVVVGTAAGTNVTNLVALGQPIQVAPNLRVPLADWGYAVVLGDGKDTTAAPDTKGYRAFVTALAVHLTADHGGLPAGSEIDVGFAEAGVQTAPPPPKPIPAPAPSPLPGREERADVHKTGKLSKEVDLRVQAKKGPLKLLPELSGGPYVFPVYGAVSYGDTFGALRNDVDGKYHHGDDVFGQIGQPILAVAEGTLFDVGFQKVGGYRLWLRDRQGNQFYYAHLSAYSAAARSGAYVKAGAVIGFMGTTGDALGTFPHLHFEVHPVSLLFLGYNGAVNPTPYLRAWSPADDLKFARILGWAPTIRGGVRAPEPGAILLGVSDISTADGLDPASLSRALRRPVGVAPLVAKKP
jgi:murein DD-endopeptidase MepM/ murein hydrolase activator NlpD